MAGTFSQIYIQIVFAVKFRKPSINPVWEEDLHKYITGIVKGFGQNLLAINGIEDHIHILISLKPDCRISDLVREIKKASNKYVNETLHCNGSFCWQSGYGVFSYDNSSVQNVINYIKNQKVHHKRHDLRNEMLDVLTKREIPYDEKYVFND